MTGLVVDVFYPSGVNTPSGLNLMMYIHPGYFGHLYTPPDVFLFLRRS